MYLNCFYHALNILKNECMIHLIDGMALFFYFILLGFDVSQPETSDSSDIEPSWRHSQLCDMFNCHQQCPGSFQPFCSKLCFYVCGWASSCKVKLQESCPKKSFFGPLLFNIKYKDNSRYLLLDVFRYSILNFFQDIHVRISAFLQDKVQHNNGR